MVRPRFMYRQSMVSLRNPATGITVELDGTPAWWFNAQKNTALVEGWEVQTCSLRHLEVVSLNSLRNGNDTHYFDYGKHARPPIEGLTLKQAPGPPLQRPERTPLDPARFLDWDVNTIVSKVTEEEARHAARTLQQTMRENRKTRERNERASKARQNRKNLTVSKPAKEIIRFHKRGENGWEVKTKCRYHLPIPTDDLPPVNWTPWQGDIDEQK